MKELKIFRVEAERTKMLDILVLAENRSEAETLVLKAIRDGELKFEDYCYDENDNISSSHQVDVEPKIEKEIKDYGILTPEGEIEYDPNIVEAIHEANRHQIKEEYLKQNHLELSLGV